MPWAGCCIQHCDIRQGRRPVSGRRGEEERMLSRSRRVLTAVMLALLLSGIAVAAYAYGIQ